MLNGGFGEGEAVLRIKTDLTHPNPAVRDWPALRIIDPVKYPHPRVGSKYRVWPLFNFGSAIDDHLLGVSHVIRGKEHLTNAPRTEYLYKALSWNIQEYVHYGRLKTTDIKLSKSLMVKEIDKIAHRYSFIANPITVTVSGVERTYNARLPLHPERKDLPDRIFKVVPENGSAKILISSSDVDLLRKSKVVRLMELFNIEIKSVENNSVTAAFHSQDYMKAREVKAPLVNWLLEENNMIGEVVMPDASRMKGPVETNIRREKVGSIIQMVRFGFGRIDTINGDRITVYYAHR